MKTRVLFGIGGVVITLIVAVVFLQESLTQDNPPATNQKFDASHFSEMRIENEDKLDVPREKVEEVWDYMVDRMVTNKEFLRSLDTTLTSFWNDELFVDVYFDTPDLVMLGRKSGIRHRTRYNLTDSTNRKHGRQLMQVKLNNIDENVLNRGEIKFDIEYPEKIKTADDVHPVLGIVKASDRDGFKQVLSDLGIDPYSLKKILTNTQRRRSLYIPRNGEQFISIRLDECSSEKLWIKWKHVELEPELNEIPYTAADSAGKAYMESINMRIVDDIRQRFPEIKRDLTPKYNKAFNYFDSKIPLLRFLIKSGLVS